MLDTVVAQKTLQALRGLQSAVLITHEKPDGDAIASTVALKEMLHALGLEQVRLVCCDEVPGVFQFLAHPPDFYLSASFL